MLEIFTSQSIWIIVFGLVLAVAIGGYLCYTRIDYSKKASKKTSSKKKSTKKK